MKALKWVAVVLIALFVLPLALLFAVNAFDASLTPEAARYGETRAPGVPDAENGYYALLAVFSLWASLGPGAGLYAALYRLIPGFDFVRVPSRITLLTVLALAVLAGIGFDRLHSRLVRLSLAALALLELAAFPLETQPYPIPSSPNSRCGPASRWASG